ncbi:unnamed protein product [Candida verbasci]|uniref:U3 small nucleolar RNA-associated protein 22 n=1 Tax=Candida verbasci TaxID=1227364 RepID=A0A9W4XJV6_9ASCO|nr:unnamed protein product [Candida verbasci]
MVKRDKAIDEEDDYSIPIINNGTEQEDQEVDEPPVKKQKKQNKQQLTAQDIQIARETADLFKSNIFKLQIDELMRELKIKKSHEDKMEKVLRRLHDLIKQVPSIENLSLQQAEQHFKKLVIPFPDPKPSKLNYRFSYIPSEDISLVGSYGLKTGCNQKSSIEIALTMPKELFQAKDYLNYRAFYKKAFYLAYLAEHLITLSKKNNLPLKISYHYLNGDVLNPVLRLESIQTENPDDLIFNKTKFNINLIVAFPFGIFDAKKLLPDKNCIRVQTETETESLPPTPLYNSSLITQSTYDYYLKYLYTMKRSTEGFKDACVLGRLWLQQRGFDSSVNNGGFGHFEFAILMSALLNGGGLQGNKILLHGFSSYQLFKGVIKYLAEIDLSKGYLSFSSLIGENITSKYKSDGFNVPTIFDKNAKLNILWKMTSFSYLKLKQLAIQNLDLLNDVVKDRFDAILLQKSDYDAMKYDIVLNFSAPDELYDLFGPLEKISYITFDNYLKNKLFKILTTALGDRATSIDIRKEKISKTFALNKRKASNYNNFIIGLQLNSEECDKLVTKGPNSEDKEAGLKFRSFWGSKVSLRRFKDGSVQHCVVWNLKDEPVVLTIIKSALDIHLQDVSQHVATDVGLFERLPTPLLPTAANQVITSLVSFTALRNSFENLSKTITNLKLPLNVKSLLPASSSLRYTSLLQPVPFAASNPDFWNDCILQFETSTRWPDEISALEKTKTAFLIKASDLLNDLGFTTFLTKDDSIPFNEHITLLNILTPDGYGFRIRVLTERDEILYLRAVANSEKQKSLVQEIYLKFNQKTQGVIKHTRTITQLAQHFHFYSPTVRFFKQWLDSQLLLSHFNDELIELIALKPFVDPAPYSVPHSIENGFLQILNFLSNWNWKEDPLILDLVKSNVDEFNDKLTIQAYRVIETNFETLRKSDPSGIKTQLFIGSKDDPSGILWSHDLTLPISSRLTALSRAAITLLKQNISEHNLDLIFTPALKDYDFTINVKSTDLTTTSGILPPNTYKNLIQPLTSFPDDITTRYDLIQEFIKQLNTKFGNTIIFSSKKFGANVIGGIFVPSNLTKKKFRVNLGYNVKPDTKDEVVINKDVIFKQIHLLGGNLIEKFNV